ncbi:MAG TPA: RHS repeat-associated core domain-containing protein [Thermoanaerobaculia bacterium]|nr:RHS repeat-associated core domain-containing protein [Thermoanaerobaculia bacterium]
MTRRTLVLTILCFAPLALVPWLLPSAGPGVPAPQAAQGVVPVTTPGTVTASHDVSPQGAAVYSLPIEVPPGTMGVEPELSVTYSSQAHDGVVGWGFSLQGIPAVRRCAAVRALDGYNGAVRIDSRDRFCLGDQRLILVSGGNYGDPGTVYNTAAQSWAEIRAEGRCGSGPCSFVATTADGTTAAYGTTRQARSIAPGKDEIFSWFVETVSDRYGNTQSVAYSTYEASGEVLPASISYTSNARVTPVLEARRKVRFEYTERDGGTFGDRYQAGLRFRATRLLTAIATEVDGQPVLRYQLDYTKTGRPGRYRLASFQMCGADGLCFPATRFDWQSGDPRVASPSSDPTGLLRTGWCGGDGAVAGSADFDGDGRADLTCSKAGTHQVLLSTGTGLASPNSNPDGVVRTGWCTDGETGWSDFDGDAKADLHCDTAAGSHSVLVSDGRELKSPNSQPDGLMVTNWCPASQGSTTCSTSWFNYAATGRSDAVCDCSDGRHLALLSTGTALQSASSQPDGLLLSNWCVGGEVTWADFDGDGRADLNCRDLSRRTISVMLSTSEGPKPASSNAGGEVVSNWCVDEGDQFGHADFNADFLADAFCHRDGVQRVLVSTGRELKSPTSQPDGTLVTGWCRDGATLWDDFDGDGLADLQCVGSNGDQSVLVSDGTGVTSPTGQPDGLIQAGWCRPEEALPQRIDFNGDGLGDFACQRSNGQQAVLLHAPGKSTLMDGAVNGLGGSVAWEYAALPQGSGTWYTRGENVRYPQVELSAPFDVVRRVRVGDGRGQTIDSELLYRDARVDVDQQVFLGFRAVTRVEPAIGRRTETVNALDYPLVGFVEQVTVSGPSAAGGGVIVPWQRTTSTPYQREVANDVWFVATASNVQTQFDATGKPAFSLSSRFEYDPYGNLALAADLGNPNDPADDHFTCTVYQNQTTPWRIGFERAAKVTRDEAACRDFLARWPAVEWNPSSDLRWSRTEYDSNLSVSEAAAWDATLSDWLGEAYGHDGVGNRTRTTDAAGQVWTATYDETYRTFPAETRTPPDSQGAPLIELYRTDPAFGLQVWHQDANGNRFETVYDGLGRERERHGPPPAGGDATVLLARLSYGGDAASGWYAEERDRVTWEGGDEARWSYVRVYQDGLERTWKQVRRSAEARDVVVETQYDAVGRAYRESFPRYSGETARWTTTTYDLLDRPLTVTRPDGVVDRTDYEQGALRVVTTLASGTPDARRTVAGYDARENLVSTEAANGGLMTYGYDRLSQRVHEKNPNGVETVYVYDSLGRVIRRENGDTGITTQRFDATGRLAESTDAVSTRTTFHYDSLGRVTRRSSQPATGAAETFDLTYDDPAFTNARGELTRVDGPESRLEHGYDAYGHPVTSRQTIAGETHVRQAAVSPLGEETEVTVDGGPSLRRDLYDDGSLAALRFRETTAAPYETWSEVAGYTALGQPTAVSYRNGTTTRYDYYPTDQALGWLQSWRVERQGSAVALSDVDYSWNRVGQLAGATETVGDAAPRTQTYAYEATGWLSSARGAYGNLDYRYDTAGNLTLKDGVTYTMETASDRLASASNGLGVSYRDDGTIAGLTGTGATWSYVYDPAARLAQVTRDGETVMTALYDVDGRRLRRTDADGSESRYFFADWDVQSDGGATTSTFYLLGNDEMVAAVTRAVAAPGQEGAQARAARLGAESGLYRPGTVPWIGLRLRALAELAAGPGGLAAARLLTLVTAAAAALWLLGFALVGRRRGQTRTGHRGTGLGGLAHGGAARVLVVPMLTAALLLIPLPARADLGPGGGLPQPGVLFFHQNVVESVALTTGEDGAPSTQVSYLPYGEIDEPRSSGPDDFRAKFTGQERDVDTGLYDYGQRYYHAGLGRFLQPDPEEQFVSPYTYVGNNPLSAVDPDGTVALAIVALFVGVAVLGGVTGAYFGAAAVNDSYNPAHWDWASGKTWGGLVAGAIVGAASAVLGTAAWFAGPAVGIAADIVLGAVENVFFSALAGGGPAELALAAVTGGVFGGLLSIGGVVASRAASSLARGASKAVSSAARQASRSATGSAFESLATTAADGALARSTRRGTQRGARTVARGCSSFPAGVPVLGPDGSMPVEAVAVGGAVTSLVDPAYGAAKEGPQPRHVLSLLSREVDALAVVELDGEAIRATPEHPFWTLDRGWVEAADLLAGDRLLDAGGEAVPVVAVGSEAGPATVYNFQVAAAETYYVGASRVLVHNPSCSLSKLPPTKTMTTARQKKLWQNKIDALVKEFGDRKIWYKDPAKGRRWLDLSPYAARIGKKYARVSLSKFGKGSTRAQHFGFADRQFGIKKGRLVRKVKHTWHHHPTTKQMDLVPTTLHKKLGHEGSFKHLF